MEDLEITGVTLASFTAPSNGMVVINKRLPILEGMKSFTSHKPRIKGERK
jgi:hypothetical protein